jgi:hypothetical protein
MTLLFGGYYSVLLKRKENKAKQKTNKTNNKQNKQANYVYRVWKLRYPKMFDQLYFFSFLSLGVLL